MRRDRKRLAFLEFNQVVKDVSLTCRIFKISRQTFYQWQKRYDPDNLSSWQFQRVIEKYQLYPDKAKAAKIRTKKAKNRGKKKIRIHLTAIDHFHKVGYARCYKSKSSLSAFDFLLRLNLLTEGKIAAILSDNGGEWKKYFEAACQRLKITHIFTRFRTPKDNSVNERFNRTLKEEFMELNEFFEEHLAQDTLTQANQTLTDWLIFYNFQRPHQSLSYQTPMEYTCSRVSAMYPSNTPSCLCQKKVVILI